MGSIRHNLTGKTNLILLLITGMLGLVGCSKNETETTIAASPTPSVSAQASTTQTTASSRPYVLGTKLQFGTGGNSEQYRGPGWSGTEAEFTWTDGTAATLTFGQLPAGRPLQLQMTLIGLTKAPELPYQSVKVSANGHDVIDWQVNDRQQFTATIPADAITSDGSLQLQFQIPQAASPKSLGINADARRLGIACVDLVIEESR